MVKLEQKTRDQHNNDGNNKINDKRCQMGHQKGAGRQKFQVGCAIPLGMHSSPIGNN